MRRWRLSWLSTVPVGNRRRIRVRKWVSIVSKFVGSIVQAAGGVVLIAGLWQWDVTVALSVAGLMIIGFGVGLEKRDAE